MKQFEREQRIPTRTSKQVLVMNNFYLSPLQRTQVLVTKQFEREQRVLREEPLEVRDADRVQFFDEFSRSELLNCQPGKKLDQE